MEKYLSYLWKNISLSMVSTLAQNSAKILCDPMDYSPASFHCLGKFPGKSTASGLPFPPPGDLSDPGIECRSLALQAGSLPLSHEENPKIIQNP